MSIQESTVSPALPGVSVIIVNYHTPGAIDTALTVLLAGDGVDLDVVVVDQEPTADERLHHARWAGLPGVRLLVSEVNLGFAGGCNLGSEAATNPWLLFLNSDAWMTREHVRRLLSAAVQGSALAAGPLSNRASDVQTIYTWDATTRFRTPEAYLAHRHDVDDPPFAYHRLSGVCLLVRADAFADVGRFERAYGLGYFEDDELTVRLARRGTLLVVPSAFVWHEDGLSWRSTGRHERHLSMYVNRLLYLYRNCTTLLEQPVSRPLVTVVVTTYNRPELLARALASITAQTYSELEVIVVNDAGVDVRDVVERARADGGVKEWQYLVNETNRGKPASINAALAVATGELVAHLDDDDELMPHHVLAAVNALAENPRLDAVYFASLRRKVDVQDRTLSREVVSQEWDVLRLMTVNLLPNCALVHRRSLLDRVGTYRELDAVEDWDFLRRASLVGTFLHLPLVTSSFRVRKDGASRNGIIKRSLQTYLATERRIRVGPAPVADASAALPSAWASLAAQSLLPVSQRDAGRLANLVRLSGIEADSVVRLRPDLMESHLRDRQPTVERCYAALLCAAGGDEQTGAVASLMAAYMQLGNSAAVGRLHGYLSYVTAGTEVAGTGDALETARKVYEREGLRGLREVTVLSARRRSNNLARRLRGV